MLIRLPCECAGYRLGCVLCDGVGYTWHDKVEATQTKIKPNSEPDILLKWIWSLPQD